MIGRLLTAAAENHGLAVVVAGESTHAFDRELCVEGDTLLVKPLGLNLVPISLPAETVRATADLLATAADLEPGDVLDIRGSEDRVKDRELLIEPSLQPLRFEEDGTPVVPPGHVLVRLLGPVEVVGGERPIDRRRCIELVAYLALHRDGVDEGRIKSALWPESVPTQAAFNETISRARRVLGHDPGGKLHVLPVYNRRYRVGPFVTTDVELVTKAGAAAACLVRGLPFEGTARGYEWAYEEGYAHQFECLIENLGTSARPVEDASTPAADAGARN